MVQDTGSHIEMWGSTGGWAKVQKYAVLPLVRRDGEE